MLNKKNETQMMSEREKQLMNRDEVIHNRIEWNHSQDQALIKEMIIKEARIKSLEQEKNNYEKEINHIKRSKTWKHSKFIRRLQTIITRIIGKEKRLKQKQQLIGLETTQEETQKELYKTRELLQELTLDDRLLDSNKTTKLIRETKEEGKLIDYLNRVIEDKKIHENNYNRALKYAARLFMNEKVEYKNFVYNKVLSALKTEDIPEFMIRAGLETENSIPLQQVSSFRSSLSMRMRQKQLHDSLPEFTLEDKVSAYQFIDQLNIKRPETIDGKYSIIDIPIKNNIVIKPVDGAGARGVYLVHRFDHIVDVNRKREITSWEDLAESMMEDIKTGRVSEDQWLIEELIFEDEESSVPASDIKFYCFYGKVGLILEITRYPERKHCWWTASGERIRTGKYEEDLFKGQGVSKEEIELAANLSMEIPAPFIRIDFLRSHSGLVFGEFTAKPGNYDEFDEETDQWLGDYFLEAQGRLTDDLLKGKQFDKYRKFTDNLGYLSEEIRTSNS